MACSPTPTETHYTTAVRSLLSTTLSDSVSTLPAVTTTVTTLSCSLTVRPDNETACVDVEVPFVTTIDGGDTTVQVPLFTFFNVTEIVPTATLFASCSSQAAVDPPPPSAPPSSSDVSSANSVPSPQSIPSSISSSLSPNLLNDPSNTPISITPTTAVSSIRTVGTLVFNSSSVTTTTVTSTRTQLPSTSRMPSPSSSDSPTAHQNNASTSDTKGFVGPIVGGILGGFFGLIGIVLLIWFLWHRRRALFNIRSRTPSPLPDVPQMGYVRSPKRDSQLPFPNEPEPKPYHYGAVGSVNSHGRGGSLPGTPRQSFYSQGHSPTTPRSYAGSARTRFSTGGLPTPPIVPSTALSPGSSQPSSRPSTPGYFGHSPPPSAFNHNVRQSWPLLGSASDDGHDGSGSDSHSHASGSHVLAGNVSPRRERLPSRLSLTFSNCEAAAEDDDGARSRALSSRSVSMSMSMSMSGETTRPASAGAEDRDERRKSVLFVVNADTPQTIPSGSGAPT